jgi:predicted permease
MQTLLNDIRHGIRLLARTPGVTVVALAALALGTGANTAIFSVVHAVLLAPLPFEEPDRLIRIYEDSPAPGPDTYFTSVGAVLGDYPRADAIESVGGYWRHEVNVVDGAGEPARLRGVSVSPDFFRVLRLQPVLGRAFVRDDFVRSFAAAVSPCAILSWELWQTRYGGDPSIVGRKITIDGAPAEVVGVLPPGMRFAGDAQVWQPMGDNRVGADGRVPRYMDAVARLKRGHAIDVARAQLEAIAAQSARETPRTNKDWGVIVRSLREDTVGAVEPALVVLLWAVGALLLVACANVAGLLLAQAEARSRETAIRAALGATGARIARQLLTESAVLGLAGGTLGLLVAWWGISALRAFGPANVPRLDEVSLSLPVLAYTIGISFLSGLLFGLAPALRAWKPDLAPALGEGRTATAGRAHLRLRGLLVVAEVAVAVVLVIGAGLLIRSFARLAGTPPGFAPQNVLTFNVALPVATYDTWDRTIAFYDRLLERLKAQPATVAAGTTTTLPLKEELDYRLPVSVIGQPPSPNPSGSEAWYRMVSADYFRAMGVPLLRGRFFTEADGPDSPGAVIVNEAFVRKYLPGVDPVGHELEAIQGGFGPLGRIIVKQPAIVGVVGDVKQAGLASGTDPAVYYHARQAPFRNTTVVVRTHGDPRAAIADVRAQLQAVDPALPMAHVATLEQNVSNAVAQPRFQTLLLGAFAGLALLLGAVGLYGILSHSVLRRRREIGIRLALGGAPGDIRRMVVGEGLRLVAAGVGLGLALAFVATRYLETLLFGVTARDPLTFAAVPLVLAATALLASYLPVRRATRIDPIAALRE